MEDELLEQPDSNETFDDDDFFADINEEVIAENQTSTEGEETDNSKPNESQEETQEEDEKEMDYSPFLKDLSGKVKYNKENVNVESIDDVVSNYQKGLNYDKLQEKYEALQNSDALTYINNKADELGMSVDEYMKQVKEYERKQQEAEDQERLERMIENGVPEDVAREVIATAELRRELQAEKNQIAKEKKEQELEKQKEKEYSDFVESFPDVKAEDIPKDVFLNAEEKGISLTQAYKDHLYNEMKKELDVMKQNQNNSKSAIGSTQNYGGKEHVDSDPFLEGFNS